MGVPSFFKWLVGKYPSIVVPAKEDDGAGAGASSPSSPWDEPAAGPNGVYHNLYLDMNAIIHPCFHPEDEVRICLTLCNADVTHTHHTHLAQPESLDELNW
jgi:5'-3' exoribonuclease 4